MYRKLSKIEKNIIITGASSGIGYFCAKKLKEDGYRVFATVRKKDDLVRLKKEGFEVFLLDLDSSDSIKLALQEIFKSSNNNIFALFNNGAFGQPGAVEDLSRDTLRAQFETNVFGTHELTSMVIPIMRKQGYGKIIQNSSVLGFVSMRYRGAYNASKFALEGLSDTLRLELDGSGIDVVLIEPGPIRSDFRKNALSKFLQNIDTENSFFKDKYKEKTASLESKKDVPFTLGEEAVYSVLLKALGENPKPRYRVTIPTTLFWFLKRVLSTKVLDSIIKKVE